MAPVNAGLMGETGGLVLCLGIAGAGALLYGRITGFVRLPHGTAERIAGFEAGAALLAAPQRRPAMLPISLSSMSGWPVSLRSRLMRSTMAGWVLNKPRALWSSFLTGLTT